MATFGILTFVLLSRLCILCTYGQNLGAIDNLCDSVEVLTLQVGEKRELVPESAFQCWRVVGESERNDRLIRATLEDITPEIINADPDYSSCRAKWSSRRSGLVMYDGNDPNLNDALVEKCALDNKTRDLSSQTIFSTQPVLFIKWSKKTTGKVILQLVKLSDAVRKCRKSTRRSGEAYTVVSENYPNSYNGDTFDCWLLRNSDSGTMFEIYVEDIQLGNDPSKTDTECVDKVNIHSYRWYTNINRETELNVERDSKDPTNIKLLHRFCENERSRYLYFTEREILITFVTNSLRQAPGFRFNVRIIPISQSTPCTDLSLSTTSAVGIASPNYPRHYVDDLDMCWRVQFADPSNSDKYTIVVQSQDQELDPLWLKSCPEDTETLFVDRIDITSGLDPGGNVLSSECGKYKGYYKGRKVLVRTAKPFNIRFQSDEFFTKKGFSYQLIPEPKFCKEVFVHPGDYPIQLTNNEAGGTELCWKLETSDEWDLVGVYHYPGKHAIKLDINQVKLDANMDCLSSYLRIYDGSSPAGKLLKEYCPRDNTTGQVDLFSITHEVYIRFKSTVQQNYNITVQALREGVADALNGIKQYHTAQCTYKNIDKDNKYDDMVLILTSGWRTEFYSGCELLRVRDPDPNTQVLLKVDLIETAFLGTLRGNCRTDYVVIHDGPDLNSPVLINICKDVLDGYIVSRGPTLSFLAISSSSKEWFKAEIKLVAGGRYGNECISIPISDVSQKYFISSPNYPFTHPGVVDICWIAYLTDNDKGKRIVFKTKSTDTMYENECKNLDTKASLVMYNDQNTVLQEEDFCGYFSVRMDRDKKCPYNEYIKIRFKSTGQPVTTGFYGYFHVISKGEACKGGPPLISKNNLIYIIIAIIFFVILLLCVLSKYNWGRDWCKKQSTEQSAEAAGNSAPRNQDTTEQEQIAMVSEPPSYNHVVENDEQFPVNRSANTQSNPPNYNTATSSQPSGTVTYRPDNPEQQVNMGEASPMLAQT